MSARDILIKILTKGDSSGSEKVGQSLDQLGKKATAVGKTLSLTLTAPLVGLGAISAKFAADANESLSKLEAVFGQRADAMNQWIAKLRESVPATTAEIQDLVSGTQDLLVPLGMADSEAEEMTKSIVTLAGDLASFNNIPVAEALAKIRSGLVGQYEPLLQFGVALNAGTVKAKAFEQGIGDGKRELTASERALVSYKLILEGTSKAHGDAEKTKGSDANAAKFLLKEYTELATVLGQSLLPAIKPVVTALTDVAKAAQDLSPGMQQLIVGVGALAAGVGPLLIGLGAMARGYTAIAAVTPKAVAGIRAVGLAAKTAAPYLAALAAGYAVGTAIDKHFDVSGKIADMYGKIGQGERDRQAALSKSYGSIRDQVMAVENLAQQEATHKQLVESTGALQASLAAARKKGDDDAVRDLQQQLQLTQNLFGILGGILDAKKETAAAEQDSLAAAEQLKASAFTQWQAEQKIEDSLTRQEKIQRLINGLDEEGLATREELIAKLERENALLDARISGDPAALKDAEDAIAIERERQSLLATGVVSQEEAAKVAKERIAKERQAAAEEEKRRNAPPKDPVDNTDLTQRIALTRELGQAEQQQRQLREGVTTRDFIDLDGTKKQAFFEGGKRLGDSDDFGRTTDPVRQPGGQGSTPAAPPQQQPTAPAATAPQSPNTQPPDLSPVSAAVSAVSLDLSPVLAAIESMAQRLQQQIDNNASRIDQIGN